MERRIDIHGYIQNRFFRYAIVLLSRMITSELPDLESLRCFAAAGVRPSFRVAAASVGLSPAAFGARIKQLEEQVGSSLFHRTTRRLALTAAGQRFLVAAKRLLDDASVSLRVARDETVRVPWDLTVGTRFELGLSWIVPSLDRLSKERPERTIHLVFGDTPDLLTRVRGGGADCVVTSARLIMADIAYELLHHERYVFVGSAALLKRRTFQRPEHSRLHTLLDISADLPLFQYFVDAAPRDVWGFARTQYLGTIAAIRHRVLDAGGVAVLPRYFVQADLKVKRLVQLFPRTQLRSDDFRLIWRAGHRRESELRLLAEELRSIPLR